MAAELIPAVLATTSAQLRQRATVAQRLAPTIHLDVMDGKFVTTRSVGAAALEKIRWQKNVEVHAMVKSLSPLLAVLGALKPQRVYLHVELGRKLLPMIALLRSRKIELGLAINPTSNVTLLQPYLRYAKSVLVMSVKPGKYHALLWTGTFARIRQLHRRWPKMIIAVDGAMNAKTLPQAQQAGATRTIIGSDVMLNVDPVGEWKALKKLTR